MSIVQAYYFDDARFLDMLNAYFPIDPTNIQGTVDFSYFDHTKIDKLMLVLEEILRSEKIHNVNLETREREKLTVLPVFVRRQIEKLFDNEDIMVYGHGGAALDILKSGKMQCKYSDLESHFIPLEQTNESMEQLNYWPHKDASQVLIMGLNRRELNPIYKKDKETGNYYIPSEYFMGYYDREQKRFFPNKNYADKHRYKMGDEVERELYPRNLGSKSAMTSDQEDFNNILKSLSCIGILLRASNIVPLDKEGLDDVRKQITYKMSCIYGYASNIDDEKITEYNNRKNNNTNSNSNQSEISTMLSDFDFDYEKKDKPEKSI